MKREDKGITLIALVVTIVVLLILAGISISMLLGENGIIKQANDAKEKTEIAEEKEAINIAYVGASAKKQGTTDVTAGDMQDEFDYNGTKATASGNINIQFTESKRWYKIIGGNVEGPYDNEPPMTLVEKFIQAQEDNCQLTHETCSNERHLHIGDYLDYNPNSGSTTISSSETGYNTEQTYTVDQSTTWRVLGLSEDNTQLIIISGSPIKRDGSDIYLHLKGAQSYTYCKDTLDKICGIYKNEYASEARSINIEDINKALGIVKEGNKVYLKNDSSKTNIDKLGILGQIYTYKEGDYSPESYLGIGSITPGENVTATVYHYDYEDPNIIDQNSTLWEILFDGTTSEKHHAKSYWLASQAIGVNIKNAYFGPVIVYGGTGWTRRAYVQFIWCW